METLVWIIAGCLLGWVSFAYLRYNEERGVAVSMAIGAVGALIGAKAIAPLFVSSAAPLGAFSAPALFFAGAASAALLVLGNLLYRRWGV